VIVVGYAFEEAWASILRAGRSALVSVGTIAIAFLTLGGFMLVSVNVQGVLERWLESAEVSVYLYDDLSEDLRSGLEQHIREQPAVAAVEFVSKARALERFRADFPELLDVTTGVAENPFPAAFEIRLKPGDTGAAAVEDLTTSLAGRDGVADVRYDRRWLTRLTGIVTTARLAGAVVAGVLMLGAAFTVAVQLYPRPVHCRRAAAGGHRRSRGVAGGRRAVLGRGPLARRRPGRPGGGGPTALPRGARDSSYVVRRIGCWSSRGYCRVELGEMNERSNCNRTSSIVAPLTHSLERPTLKFIQYVEGEEQNPTLSNG
jgi:hypothetical protein